MAFWSDVFPALADVGYYYTYLSFYLFLIALVLPDGVVRYTLLLNSVVVGLLGNGVYAAYLERHQGDLRDLYPDMTQEEITRSIFRTNLAHHTLPMAAALWLLWRASKPEAVTFGTLVALLWLVWLQIPYAGRVGGAKCASSYPSAGSLLALTLTLGAAFAGTYAVL
jgi:hypothetical protein